MNNPLPDKYNYDKILSYPSSGELTQFIKENKSVHVDYN